MPGQAIRELDSTRSYTSLPDDVVKMFGEAQARRVVHDLRRARMISFAFVILVWIAGIGIITYAIMQVFR